MSASSSHTAFGDLRGLMNVPALDVRHRRKLWRLICRVSRDAPKAYAEHWMPYMASFPHHFKAPLANFNTLEQLERAHQLLPFAAFSLDPETSYGIPKEELLELFESPAARAISSLRPHARALDTHTFSRLLESPYLSNITSFDLNNNVQLGQGDLDRLAQSQLITQLETLRVSGTHFGSWNFAKLLSSERAGNLRTLDLTCSNLNNDEFLVLARATSTASLHTIIFKHVTIANAQSWQTFAASPHIRNLRMLDVGATLLGDRGFIELVTSPRLGNLRMLKLDGITNVTASGIMALASSDTLTKLEHLDLQGLKLTREATRALANSPWPGKLEHLIVKSCQMNDEDLETLTDSAHSSHLHTLDLSHNDISLKALDTLLHAPIIAHIRDLRLKGLRLGDGVAKLLASSPHIHRLERLELGTQELSDAGMFALANAPWIQNLKSLKLLRNKFTARGLQVLLGSMKEGALEELVVEINDEIVDVLASAPSLSELHDLEAQPPILTPAQLDRLARSETFPKEVTTALRDRRTRQVNISG